MNVAEHVYQHLEAAGLLGGATGWTGLINYFPESPDQVIVLAVTSSDAPETTFDAAYPRLSVRVRGTRFSYAATLAKVVAVYDELHRATLLDTGVSPNNPYVYLTAVQSPVFQDYDDEERPTWVFNLKAMLAR